MALSNVGDAFLIGGPYMKQKIMQWNYKKLFTRLVVLAVVLALICAVAVPLSLSRQIHDAASLAETHDRHEDHEGWKEQITPPDAEQLVLLGALLLLWLLLGAVYWLSVIAWLYKNAVQEGMNKSLWPILGLFFNLFAVFAFLIVRDRPGRVAAA